jgi:hypothetical protein
VIERLSRLLETEVRSLTRVQSSGYTVAYHGIAELADGRTAFVKAATEPVTAGFIRDEQRVLGAVSGPFVPAVLAMDDGDPPLLVLEDLRAAHWPPPWDDATIAAVRETLAAVAAAPLPDVVPPVGVHRDRLVTGWGEIGSDPEPFLSLGVCSPAWLTHALPTLREASESAPIGGDSLLCTSTSAATTSASPSGAQSSSTGTTLASGIRTSTWPPGCPRSGSRAGPSRRQSCPGPPASRRCSRASSAHAPGCRLRRPRRTFGRFSSRSYASRCRGRLGSLACLRPGRFGR